MKIMQTYTISPENAIWFSDNLMGRKSAFIDEILTQSRKQAEKGENTITLRLKIR